MCRNDSSVILSLVFLGYLCIKYEYYVTKANVKDSTKKIDINYNRNTEIVKDAKEINNFSSNDSMMFSENNNSYMLDLYRQVDFKEFPNTMTPHSLNTNIRIKQYHQNSMFEQRCVSNIPKCIVRYNTDQSFSYEEFYNSVPMGTNRMGNIPYMRSYPQISLSYSPKAPVKVILKRKRRRTIFTTEQIIALEEVFKTKPYVHFEERNELMKKLSINERSIKIWFQNRRRLSEKKSEEYNLDSPLSETSPETVCERLNLIESYIEKNSDENGYVTLDDEMMGNLMNIVDECLSRDICFEEPPEESVTTVFSDKIIYEAISP